MVRKILPTINGLSLANVQQSVSNIIDIEDDLLESWQTNKLNVVVFIQNKLTKEVLQAGTVLK